MTHEFSHPKRPRRLRQTATLRRALADVHVAPEHLIYPLFVGDLPQSKPVASMPGVSQLTVPDALQTIRDLIPLGLRQFIFFGITPHDHKDPEGSFAWHPEAPVNRLLRMVRDAGLDVVLYADTCFCEYTSHGHCGVINADDPGIVDNDKTLANLAKASVAQARAGADVIAPSGMMDGMVGAIRSALDAHGFPHVAILSYSVKYASNFYGPFRDAGEGGMKFGDRKGYQMDYQRSREWRTELELDLAQGADMVMVKPACAYLDIIHQVRASCQVPVVAYHVSGEYAMLHAAADRGWLDLRQAAMETTLGIRRAGADLIITYFAPQIVRWIA